MTTSRSDHRSWTFYFTAAKLWCMKRIELQRWSWQNGSHPKHVQFVLGDESKSKIPPKRRDFPHIFSRISARISRFIALCHMPKSWKTRNEQNWHLSHQYDFYVTNSAEKLLKFFFETSGKEIPRFWITMHADKTLLRETNYSRSLLSVAKRISYTTISV